MRRWAYMLGGLIAWTVHFSGLYAMTSLDAQTAAADTHVWRAAALALTLICGAVCAGLAAVAVRRAGREAAEALVNQLALIGAALALVAICWQSFAFLIV